MFKRFLALLVALFAVSAFAAVDVNKASQAELETVKGIGPAIAGKILDERKKGNFKDWNDMIERVKGVGEGNAAKFSAEGLTVNGQGFKGAAAAPKADAKTEKAAKGDAKAEKAPKADAKAEKPAKAEKAEKAASKADGGKKDKKAEKAAAPASAASKK